VNKPRTESQFQPNRKRTHISACAAAAAALIEVERSRRSKAPQRLEVGSKSIHLGTGARLVGIMDQEAFVEGYGFNRAAPDR
jgi:hypothetical protein